MKRSQGQPGCFLLGDTKAPSDGMRGNFLSWAIQNLDPGDYARVKEIDQTYRETAQAAGLMIARDAGAEDMAEAMKRWKMRNSK